MEELKKIERELMSQEEFENYISRGNIVPYLITYNGVHRFKSIRRAMRRGHVTHEGIIIPRKLLNNRLSTKKKDSI